SRTRKTVRLVMSKRGRGGPPTGGPTRPAVMRPPDGEPVSLTTGEDPRHKLVDWMVDTKNPYFARAIANRYWAHFFGRGLVDPLDDMRVTNPPSNPALLDALSKDLVHHNYSLQPLI